tara:strand:+ start:69 stop:506 length:438 start_codon:yes stop_codon:yes gene_type:complete
MKNLLSALLLFSILFTVGCDDDDATEDASLVGVWEFTSGTVVTHSSPEVTETYTPPDVSNTLVLADDGSYAETGTFEDEIQTFSGTWSATGNVLTFVVTSGTDIDGTETWLNNYTLSGDGLTLVAEEAGDNDEDAQTITLVYARQ